MPLHQKIYSFDISSQCRIVLDSCTLFFSLPADDIIKIHFSDFLFLQVMTDGRSKQKQDVNIASPQAQCTEITTCCWYQTDL